MRFYKLKIKVFLGLSYLTIYNPAALRSLLGCKKCEDTSSFYGVGNVALHFYDCRNCRLCAAPFRDSKISGYF